MIKLVKCNDSSARIDFEILGGDVVLYTIVVSPQFVSRMHGIDGRDGVEIAMFLPAIGWMGTRHFKMPDVAEWLVKMGVNPQPILDLAAERGCKNEVIAEANEAVAKVKAQLVPPVDYLVIFMRCGVPDGYGYLPLSEVVSAMEEYCDTEIGTVNNGDFFSVTDETGERDAFAYPLYQDYAERAVPAAGTAIPVAIRMDIKDRAACGGWLPPETPGEWLAWILDEATLQTEQAESAQDDEERQARLKYVALLKDTATRLIKAGVEAAKLPWQQQNKVKLTERWHDGLREGVERVKADVELDSYGVAITVENAKGEYPAQVLVEFYDGAVTAHVWDAEDFGGDPTETVELFKVTAEVQHG
ncbi:MAG: hypothetical protein RBT75_18330 [Anaerolineae bacterium]|jgi:hypothetical protein|nr:hypothetical protein [Anaerolineae bacterium]